jgi:hypothetical protein
MLRPPAWKKNRRAAAFQLGASVHGSSCGGDAVSKDVRTTSRQPAPFRRRPTAGSCKLPATCAPLRRYEAGGRRLGGKVQRPAAHAARKLPLGGRTLQPCIGSGSADDELAPGSRNSPQAPQGAAPSRRRRGRIWLFVVSCCASASWRATSRAISPTRARRSPSRLGGASGRPVVPDLPGYRGSLASGRSGPGTTRRWSALPAPAVCETLLLVGLGAGCFLQLSL